MVNFASGFYSDFLCGLKTGKASYDKLNEVREAMKKLRAEIFIVTSLDEIACKCIVLPSSTFLLIWSKIQKNCGNNHFNSNCSIK